MHSLLQRQLRRYAIDAATLTPETMALLGAVSDAYDCFDADRLQLERSLEISSQESLAINEAMRSTNGVLGAILESTADGILSVRADGQLIHSNARFADVWNIPQDLMDDPDGAGRLALICAQVAEPDSFVARIRDLLVSAEESLESITLNDGRIIERYSRPLVDADGIAGRVWSFRDVTQSRRAAAALKESEERFRALVQNASDMIIILDALGAPTYASPSVKRIMGFSLTDLQRVGVLSLIHPDDLKRGAQSLTAVLAERGPHPETVLRFQNANGAWREIEMVANNMLHDPAVAGVVYNARDVTDRSMLERQLRHQAFHDPLTGLANRALCADRIANAIERGRRTRDTVAVLFVDVDNFKSINDAFGHAAGDELLVGIGTRITKTLRPGDTAARVGGDEFVLLFEGLQSAEAVAVGERIIEALRSPFEVEGRDVFVEASIGVAVGGADEATVDGLLRNADAAMYVAKSRGKARVELYHERMHASTHDRLQLLADLQRAIELEQFVIQYQPLFELASRRLVGAEALVRWDHPERGFIQPTDFIPLAEEGGVIHALGGWVLREACAQLKRWQQEYPQDPPLHIAVNVSGHQLQPGIVEEVANVLATSGLEPSTLVLEVTETVMMRDVHSTIALLNELKVTGVRLALDDFGTGYSSLSYLRQFPFDILKIDKSFVDDVEGSRQHALTAAIVEVGRALELELVAEGIERAEQLERLLSLNCDIGQGYFFARPLYADDMDALLVRKRDEGRAA